MSNDDPDVVITFTARLPRGLLEAIDKEAERYSARAGGVPVSRNAALRLVLQRALSDMRTTGARAAKVKGVSAAAPLLQKYRWLHEQGHVLHKDVAAMCGCSEGTIRRWFRGEGPLTAEREGIIEAHVERTQAEILSRGRTERAEQLTLVTSEAG